jgi:hypothetical protein
MTRVALVCGDLLLGMNLAGALGPGGHEVELVSDPAQAEGEVVVAVLDGRDELLALGARPSVAVYAHTDVGTRDAARAAGFDLVVPRSRFMREGPELVERVIASAD